ncbi:phosphonate metabolism transcriptional regulator PhnF [Spirosoma daeguense]
MGIEGAATQLNTAKAKFIELSERIIEKIKKGELLPGDQVPSENELIKTFKISNTTARKTLLEIESKGWARRIKGKGTYVLNRTEEPNLLRKLGSIYATRRGFHDSLIAEGFTPKNIVLEKTVLPDGVSSEINGRHFIINGPALKLHQLRYADDLLLKDEVKYISIRLCPKINRIPTEVSYFRIYENMFHLTITEVQQTLSVKILEPNTTNFELNKPTPAFVLDSAVICTGDQVVEIEQSYYHGDKYKFAIMANPDDTP